VAITFTLNGSRGFGRWAGDGRPRGRRTVEPRPDESLLEPRTLRERCGVHSVKDGCAPQGQCGCCLAIVGGRAVTTCAMPAVKAAGKEVLTLEGVSEAERQQMADAFVAAAGMQCGFCIPGIVVRTKHLLDQTPIPAATRSPRPSTSTCAGAPAT
jgi:aerobic-type carbon monoxide dehydrogenase small subunit (CoxS/CutS family)